MKCYYTSGNGYDVGYVGDKVNETFAYQLHSHDGIYEILYMEEGDASFWVEGTVYKMSPGDLVIARNDEMHLMKHHSDNFYKRLVVNVNIDFFEINGCTQYLSVFNNRAVGKGNYFPEKTVKESGLYEVLERMKKYIELDEKPLVRSALIEILYYLNKLPEFEPSDSGIVRDIIQYINSNITQSLSLDIIAEHFYISKYYLCRQFKKRMGIGIGKYITHKRILAVKEMYATGENLTDACIAAGFGDYSSFYIACKKIYGDSPKKILK